MSMIPTGATAPSFVGPPPPDRVEHTFTQLLEQLLAVLRTRPPSQEEIQATDDFFQEFQQIALQSDPNAQAAGAPSVASLNGQEQDYGTTPGSAPVDTGYGG